MSFELRGLLGSYAPMSQVHSTLSREMLHLQKCSKALWQRLPFLCLLVLVSSPILQPTQLSCNKAVIRRFDDVGKYEVYFLVRQRAQRGSLSFIVVTRVENAILYT